MNYAQIRRYDIANGTGIRVSIFVSGCTHKCPFCFNEEYQDFSFGEQWTDETTDILIKYLKDPVVSGLTLLGGEPMQNIFLTEILRNVKKFVKKNIWIYSGYTFEQIISDSKKLELLKECDVLVDGLYIHSLRNLKLKFRGSTNQKIIDIHKSLQENRVVEYVLEDL